MNTATRIYEEIEKLNQESSSKAFKAAQKTYEFILDKALHEARRGRPEKADILWRCYRDLCMYDAKYLDEKTTT